jgi:hypothetical protein
VPIRANCGTDTMPRIDTALRLVAHPDGESFSTDSAAMKADGVTRRS